jgi:hypothetical protein
VLLMIIAHLEQRFMLLLLDESQLDFVITKLMSLFQSKEKYEL